MQLGREWGLIISEVDVVSNKVKGYISSVA